MSRFISPPARLRGTRRQRAALATCLALVAVIAFAYLGAPQVLAQDASPAFDPAQVTLPSGQPSARAGRTTYLEDCAPCHGETGNADGPTVAELTGPPTAFADPAAIWELTPAELFFTAKFGRMQKMMPPWRNRLSDDQIWNALAYAWSLHTDEQEVDQGKAFYAESCAACHGEFGAGDGPEATEGMASFADAALMAGKSQADLLAAWQAAHPEVGAEWSSADQAATLEYLRTFTLAPPWGSPYTPGDGRITGTVRQGTAGAPLATGLEVALDAYLGFEPVAAFTSTLDAEGAFAFDGLSRDPNLNYIASVAADGISYSTDFLTLSPVTPTLASEITVYQTTDDPTSLEIDRFHWIVETEPGALLVGQVYAVGNTSDRTFTGRTVDGVAEPVTFAMQLPPNALDVAFDNGVLGDRFHQVGPVIYDTLPIPPGDGSRQIIVRYAIPYDDAAATLQQDLLYPVRDATLLVSDLPGLKVEATGLQFDSVQTMGDRAYQLWGGKNLPASSFGVDLTGLIAPGAPDPRGDAAAAGMQAQSSTTAPGVPRSTTPPIGSWVAALLAGIVTAVLVGVSIWAYQSGRLRLTYARSDLATLRGGLIEEIAHLDDLHALGEVTDNEWLRRRAQLKVQLVDIDGRLQRGRAREAAV